MRKWWDAAGWILIPFWMLCLLEGFARNDLGAFFSWVALQPLVFALNYLFLLGLCLLFFIFCSRSLRVCGLLGLGLVCALFGIASYYKLTYRLEPILWTDIVQLSDAAAAATGLGLDIDVGRIVFICGVFLMAMLLSGLKLKGTKERRWIGLPVLGLLLAVGVPFLCTFQLAGGSVRTDMADHARNEGCLYAAFATENHRRAQMSLDYDRVKVEEAYARLAQELPQRAVDEKAERPNVIFVLSESFMDEAALSKGVSFADTLMPFYQELVKRCRTGLLYVPKIGGGTSETEFEVLTGMRSKYAVNPYAMGLPPTNSVASVLSRKGYTASVIHWYTGVYYNRYKNLPMEGFDAVYTTDTSTREFEKTGMFVSDKEHYRAIMERMQATASSDFIFCLTMQNHGSYGYDDFRTAYGADTPFNNALTPESEKIVANYCYLLRRSDEALKTWIEALEAFDEPVQVVFFGDHLAPLGAEVYEELGISLTGDEAHLTPYFIWSNRQTLTGREDMYAYQLGAYALTLAGLNDDPFLAYVERLRQAGVTEDAAYDLLSYDALFGKQYAYQWAGLSPDNPDCQIGGELALKGFDAAAVGDAVYLRARLGEKEQAYRLCVDGQERDTRYVKETDEPLTLQCVLSNGRGVRHNESQELSFANTDDLLAQSGKLPYTALPLWESGYELTRDTWYQSFRVFKSKECFSVQSSTAVTLDGKLMDWQPHYGIKKANQYAVDADGRVYVSIAKNALGQPSGEAARAYLEAREALLYAFED